MGPSSLALATMLIYNNQFLTDWLFSLKDKVALSKLSQNDQDNVLIFILGLSNCLWIKITYINVITLRENVVH